MNTTRLESRRRDVPFEYSSESGLILGHEPYLLPDEIALLNNKKYFL